MSRRKSVREFLLKVQQKLPPGQTCRIRISDLDGYEHLSFWLSEDTDLDRFSGVYDQQMLDARVSRHLGWHDEDERDTLFITADIEL